MRKPNRRRPLRRVRVEPPDGADLLQLAASATYIISPEHKDYLTSAGPGELRSDASPCPQGITREIAEGWLRQAIATGNVGAPWSDQPYPQYAWYRHENTVFEARVSNVEQGAYKGYPLDESEWLEWL